MGTERIVFGRQQGNIDSLEHRLTFGITKNIDIEQTVILE